VTAARLPLTSRFIFQGTGAETQQTVGRATAHEAGGYRHDPDPTPPPYRAHQRQDDEQQANGDANDFIDLTDILLHGDTFSAKYYKILI
jgi:hypothetical protein